MSSYSCMNTHNFNVISHLKMNIFAPEETTHDDMIRRSLQKKKKKSQALKSGIKHYQKICYEMT